MEDFVLRHHQIWHAVLQQLLVQSWQCRRCFVINLPDVQRFLIGLVWRWLVQVIAELIYVTLFCGTIRL
jgi:hypothetical protein